MLKTTYTNNYTNNSHCIGPGHERHDSDGIRLVTERRDSVDRAQSVLLGWKPLVGKTRETIWGGTEVEKICDGTRKIRAVLKFTFYPVERLRLYPIQPARRGIFSNKSASFTGDDLDRNANRETKFVVGAPLIDGDFNKPI